jgi:WD40 repeat protein
MSRNPFRHLVLALTAVLALVPLALYAHAQGGPGKGPPVLSDDPARKGRPDSTGKDGPMPSVGSWRLKQTLRGHKGAVYSAAFFPDGAHVASAGDDGLIRVWDVGTGRLLRSTQGPGGTVSDVAISPDGRLLAACTDNGEGSQVQLLDAQTLRPRTTFAAQEDGVFEVVFSPDGRLLASGGRDHVVRLWDVRTGRLVRSLTGHDAAVTALAFTSDSRRLASAGAEHDNTVRVWDVRTGASLHTLTAHGDWVTSVAFAPGGMTLASGSRDHKLIIWDAGTGRKVRELRQPEMVYEIEFSPDGRVLAEAGGGGIVRIHDARTGRLLSKFEAHREEINEVKFAPSGLLLLTASYDATVKLWEPGPLIPDIQKPPAKWMEEEE